MPDPAATTVELMDDYDWRFAGLLYGRKPLKRMPGAF